jgi:hypothetical protein
MNFNSIRMTIQERLHVDTYTRNKRQHFHVLLIPEQCNTLGYVAYENEVFNCNDAVNIHLRVNESYATQVIIFQLPYVDLKKAVTSTNSHVLSG